MFRRFARSIKLTITVIISLCVILTSIVAFLTIKKYTYNIFVHLSVQYLMQQNQNAQLYLDVIEETSRLLSENQKIVFALETSKFDNNIIPLLDGVKVSNINITGISLYGENGPLYISSNVTAAPTFAQLKDDKMLNQFMTSTQSSLWLIRYKSISEYYNSYRNNKYGVLTYSQKIYDKNNKLLGYLLVDTDIISFYNFFKSDNNSPFKHSDTYIICNDSEILPAPYSTEPDQFINADIFKNLHVDNSYKISSNRREILIFNKIPSSIDRVVSIVSLDTIYMQIYLLMSIFVLIIAFFVTFSLFGSFFISKSITQPLSILYDKIKKQA